MTDCGMAASGSDPCMFVGRRVIAVTFLNLFWATNDVYINHLREQLDKQGLLLEEEGDTTGFLGVTMERNEG